MPDERYKGAYEAALEDVEKAQRALADAQKDANFCAVKYGVEPPFKDVASPTGGASLALKADQFTNYSSPSEAGRAFLKMRGEEKGAVTIDVIYDALLRGGYTFSSIKNDPKGGLKIALGKDTMVHRLPNGTYGLLEWYPAVKRDKEKKRAAKTGAAPDMFDDESAETGDPTPAPSPVIPDESEKGKE